MPKGKRTFESLNKMAEIVQFQLVQEYLMDDSEDTADYEYDDRSLDMFLAFLISRLDVVAKRRLVAAFLDAMGTRNERDPLDKSTCYVHIRLSDESKSRARMFLEHVESIFFYILPPRQEELYKCCINFKDMLENDWTDKGYIEFLNIWNRLVAMTGLPFSLEEDFGGLKNWMHGMPLSKKQRRTAK